MRTLKGTHVNLHQPLSSIKLVYQIHRDRTIPARFSLDRDQLQLPGLRQHEDPGYREIELLSLWPWWEDDGKRRGCGVREWMSVDAAGYTDEPISTSRTE